MMPKSLRARVTVIGLVTSALVLGVGAWVTVRALSAALKSDTNAQNEQVLDDLAATIESGVDVRAIPLPLGADGTDFLIVDQRETVLNASLGPVDGEVPVVVFSTEEMTEAEFDEAVRNGEIVESFEVFAGEDIGNDLRLNESTVFIDADDWFATERVVQSPNDGELRLIAITPFGVIDRSIDRLAGTLAVIVPLLVGLGGLALWWAIGAALRPVQRISDEANRIAPSNSGDRLPVPASGDEIADLAETLNGMLDRLDAGLTRQRQFVSDASHELRSPLSTVKGAAELIASNTRLPPEAEPNVALLQRGADRLAAVLDDLTELASGGEPLSRSEFDLEDLVLAEVATAMKLSPELTIDSSSVQRVVAIANEVQVARALHNLLANAVRHAERRVAVTAAVTDGSLEITVDDDGPGIPSADRERIFERFVRLDDGRSRDAGGSGLGLALVESIAAAHGGSITCADSPLGGARFTLRL